MSTRRVCGIVSASSSPLCAGKRSWPRPRSSFFSNDKPPPSLKDLVGRIDRTPVFFIYGERGQDGERNLERRVVGFFDQALFEHSVR